MSFMTTYKARQVLEVSADASAEAIRSAWKGMVKRYHPDRPGGSAAKLILANDAYERLSAGAPEAPARPKAEPARRPAQQTSMERRGSGRPSGGATRVAAVRDRVRAECEALLSRMARGTAQRAATQKNGGCYVDPRSPIRAAEDAVAHVARKVRVAGGQVRIEVAGRMHAGQNRVAAPAGTRAGDALRTIEFSVRKSGAGKLKLPEARRAKLFPWAQSVEIVFTP